MNDHDQMLTAMFYTFSTIAQALLAAIGLMAIFFLQQWKHLKERIDSHCNSLRETAGHPAEPDQGALQKKVDGFWNENKFWSLLKACDGVSYAPPEKDEKAKLASKALRGDLTKRDWLAISFCWISALTAFVTVGSVYVLGAAPMFVNYGPLVLLGGMVGFLLCLISYLAFIYITLR